MDAHMQSDIRVAAVERHTDTSGVVLKCLAPRVASGALR